MSAGRRPFLIAVERAVETRNDLNEPVKVWSTFCEEYAGVYFGSGAEQRTAAQTQGQQAASFEVLSNSATRAVTVTDRIVFDGSVWEIRSISSIGFNEGVKINAVRAVP